MKYFIIVLCTSLFVQLGTVKKHHSPSVADEMVGQYTGKLQDPTLSAPIDNHNITITKIDDNTIKVAPTSTTNSATFNATVTKANGIITLKSDTDPLLKNGLFAVASGRLSYLYHLGGDDERNVQVFIGIKQQ